MNQSRRGTGGAPYGCDSGGEGSSGPGTVGQGSLTMSIPRWRNEVVACGPVRYFRNAATIGRTEPRPRSVTNEMG